MYTVLFFIAFGVISGYFFRKKELKFVSRVITILIWLLLLVLGFEVGMNNDVVKQFHLLGFEALLIAFSATLGSITGAWLLWRKKK